MWGRSEYYKVLIGKAAHRLCKGGRSFVTTPFRTKVPAKSHNEWLARLEWLEHWNTWGLSDGDSAEQRPLSHPGKFVPEEYVFGVRVRATQHRDNANANFVKGKLSWIVCLWKVARMRLVL